MEPDSVAHGAASRNVPHYTLYRCILFPAVLLFLICFQVTGCSSQDDQREFERQALQPPQGITETDGNGNIADDGKEDPDDWRTAPFFLGLVEFKPAYPNPALTSDAINIRFDIVTIDSNINRLSLHVYHYEAGILPVLDTIESSPLTSGWHQFQFSSADLRHSGQQTPRGLYRLIVYDGGGNIVSYGDIEVE